MTEREFHKRMKELGASSDDAKAMIDFITESDPMSLEASLLAMSIVYMRSSTEERKTLMEMVRFKRA